MEGENARLECRVLPVGDPDLTYEWFLNGQPIKYGSRITPSNEFGLLVLDIRGCVLSDSGIYTVKVRNKAGEAVCSHQMAVLGELRITVDLLFIE